MNFVSNLEESLRDLAAEARKKHPGVKEASERATLKLRGLQQHYVSCVRKANAGGEHPTTAVFQSSELLHPFLLAANYPSASPKLLDISLKAMCLLLKGDAVAPQDGIQMVRVWTIQAQVVVAYYHKLYGKELKKIEQSNQQQQQQQQIKPASSSWFSWTSSSTTTAAATTTKAVTDNSTATTTTKNNTMKPTTTASASTQQSSPAQMDKMAQQILSCLLQLLTVLRQYPNHLTTELWTNAVALSCVWLHYVPSRHFIQQAAKSTLCQVLNVFLETGSDSSLKQQTWNDLLSLASTTSSTKTLTLNGAFSLCKATAGLSFPVHPPSPELALELMTQCYAQHYSTDNNNHTNSTLLQRTFSITLALLQQQTNHNNNNHQFATVERHLRALQWTLVLFAAHRRERAIECAELFACLLQPIVSATEACRQSHEFEDGYVYTTTTSKNSHLQQQQLQQQQSVSDLTCLFPTALLWKTALALDAALQMLSDDSADFNDGALDVPLLAETLGDFWTIGASCADHIHQVARYVESLPCRDAQVFETAVDRNVKPTMFRKAEQVITSGNGASLNRASSEASVKLGDKGLLIPSILGEALWLSMQGIIRIAVLLASIDAVKPILEETFAPSLAVLQHCLKRFPGSREIVRLALAGYASLADICIPLGGTSMHRKALLTSLCKLSLPAWGKHDASAQLEDHHVSSMLYLFRIVHQHYNFISLEWEIILRTLEQLSVLSIASTKLSNESYHAAMAVSELFGRFAPFTTCFSVQSLLFLAEALTEICKSTMANLDVVGDSKTVLPQRPSTASAENPLIIEEKETISGKIMSMGVRAIYGGNSDVENLEDSPIMKRTKNVFYEEYRRDFLRRLSLAKNSIRVDSIGGRIPYVLALLTDVIMGNSYRLHDCSDTFLDLLSSLAASSPAVRPFTMDIISMVTMSHLAVDCAIPAPSFGPGKLVFVDPMQSQLWAVEPILPTESNHMDSVAKEQGREPIPNTVTKSQVELLAPICKTIRTTVEVDIAETSLSALNSIIEGVGHNMKGEVWTNTIEAVTSLSGDSSFELDRSSAEWSACSSQAFNCLKFIVDDFLGEILSSPATSSTTLTALLDCCSSFGSSKHDVNTSLTAITVLWTIADQDSGSDSIDRALSKLVILASDSRAEVRNASVNTIFSCIVGRGSTFSAARWKMCFSETIFRVYDMVSIKALGGIEESPLSDESSSRYSVSLHHTRDSGRKLWIATQVVVLRGLTRVLRLFFSELLETIDNENDGVVDSMDGPPWFQETWITILDLAFDCATQSAVRDRIGSCLVGVELLVLCCQLASTSGINAATTPARVGTNMEVINGALREVRESQPTKLLSVINHCRSVSSDSVRKKLFLEAFEALESYKEHLDTTTMHGGLAGDTLEQILHSFVASLGKLYECCLSNELKPCSSEKVLQSFETTNANHSELEARFVRIIVSCLSASTIDHKARFLNQGQRSCLAVLRSMAENNSAEAFKQLVAIGGIYFFVSKESLEGVLDATLYHALVNFEASAIVSEEVGKPAVSNECKAFTLNLVMSIFLRHFTCQSDSNSKSNHIQHTLCYRNFVPIVTNGLCAVKMFPSDLAMASRAAALVWTNFNNVLSEMLLPSYVADMVLPIVPLQDLAKIISAARDYSAYAYSEKLCAILSLSASKTLNMAAHYDVISRTEGVDAEAIKMIEQQRNESIQLFSVCYSAGCFVRPEDELMQSLTKQALTNALNAFLKDNGAENKLHEEVVFIICDTLHNKTMESLVISVLSLLCRLVTSNIESVRVVAAKVFKAVDVGIVVESARNRSTIAEERAKKAEDKVAELTKTVDKLKIKNADLRRDVAALQVAL
jgi:hypothetical protein